MHTFFAPTHLQCLALGIAVLPLLALQIQALVSKPSYLFFPIAWTLVATYIYRAPKVGFAYSENRRKTGLGFGITAAILALVAAIFTSPSLAQFGLLIGVFGWMLIYAGIVPWTRLTAVASLMFITWPLPMGLGGRIQTWLANACVLTVSRTLDLLRIPHWPTAEFFDLKAQRLNLEEISGGIDGPMFLWFFALAILIYSRRPLLHGVATLIAVPAIYWMVQSGYLLTQALLVERTSSDYFLVGAPLFLLRLITLSVECLFIWLTSYAVSYLLDPVPVDSAEQAKRGIQGAYNQMCLWPMNVVVDRESEDQAYFDEDLETKANQELRKLPRYRATEAASDPWEKSRYLRTVLIVAGITFLLGTAALFLPREQTDNRQIARWPQDRIQSVLQDSPFPTSISLLDSRSFSKDGDEDQLTWAADLGTETAELVLLPNRNRFANSWKAFREQGYQLTSPVRRIESQLSNDSSSEATEWPFFQAEFVDAIGKPLYHWTTSILPNGEPYAPETNTGGYLLSRIRTSVPARIFGISGGPSTVIQIQMTIDAKRIFSERRKREVAKIFLDACQTLTKRIESN